jgi:hypothetical protein
MMILKQKTFDHEEDFMYIEMLETELRDCDEETCFQKQNLMEYLDDNRWVDINDTYLAMKKARLASIRAKNKLNEFRVYLGMDKIEWDGAFDSWIQCECEKHN